MTNLTKLYNWRYVDTTKLWIKFVRKIRKIIKTYSCEDMRYWDTGHWRKDE